MRKNKALPSLLDNFTIVLPHLASSAFPNRAISKRAIPTTAGRLIIYHITCVVSSQPDSGHRYVSLPPDEITGPAAHMQSMASMRTRKRVRVDIYVHACRLYVCMHACVCNLSTYEATVPPRYVVPPRMLWTLACIARTHARTCSLGASPLAAYLAMQFQD